MESKGAEMVPGAVADVAVANQGKGSSPDNRRADERYLVGGRGIWVSGAPAVQTDIKLTDISLGGLGFRSPRSLALCARGLLRFSTLCGDHLISVAVQAEVRYCGLDRMDFRIGIQFLSPDEATKKAVAAIIETRRKVAPGF